MEVGEDDLIFERAFDIEALSSFNCGVREEVSLNVDIANRIYYLLKKKKMTQREFPSFGDSSSMMRWKSASVLP